MREKLHQNITKMLQLVGLLFIISCCGCQQETFKIGAKEFTEQSILAEMVALLCEKENIPVDRYIPYGDPFVCVEGIKTGNIDLYIEYTGTGLTLLGQNPISDKDKAFQTVKEIFKPMELEWSSRLGFSNNYAIVMRKADQNRLKTYTISDLENVASKINIGCHPSYLKRPVDGMAALKRRYGLSAMPTAKIYKTKAELYTALRKQEIDVAVGYSTDGHIAALDLATLTDDKKFFPAYEAVPLVRSDALKRFPKLKSVLEKLDGLIDTETMQKMNKLVGVEGRNHRSVSKEFLESKKLLPATSRKSKRRALNIATEKTESRENLEEILTPIRRVFPNREVKSQVVTSPSASLENNEARLAVVGAESFYKIQDKDIFPKKLTNFEGLAVIGYRLAHLFVKPGSKVQSLSQVKTLGVPEQESSQKAIQMLLYAMGKKVTLVTKPIADLSADLEADKIDGIFAMLPEKSTIAEELSQKGYQLCSLEEWQQGEQVFRFPFFRLVRISAGTYSKQTKPIETISSQVVLAGPQSQSNIPLGNAGPASASTSSQPVAKHKVLKLSELMNAEEAPDPAIPFSVHLRPEVKVKEKTIGHSPGSSLLNLAVLLGICYLFVLFFREEE